MSSPIPILPPQPSSVLNPFYDWGAVFTPKVLRNVQMPPSLRARLVNFSDQPVRSGTVSYSPIKLLDGSDGRPAFESLFLVCGLSDPPFGCLHFDAMRNTVAGVQLGVLSGGSPNFQMSIPFTTSGHTVREKIAYPIHAWSSALQIKSGSTLLNLQNTVKIYLDGVDAVGHWTLSNTTGAGAFDASHDGAVVTADFSWVWPILMMDAQPDISPRAGGLWDIKDFRIMAIPQ